MQPISNYFATAETKRRRILYLHCLVLLKEALHLATLGSQIQDYYEICSKLLLVYEHVIKYSACPNPHKEISYHTSLNANKTIKISEVVILLNQDSKSVARKVQIYSLSDHST